MGQLISRAKTVTRLGTARTTHEVFAIAVQELPLICVSEGVGLYQVRNGHPRLQTDGIFDRAVAKYLALPSGSDPICERMRETCSPVHEGLVFSDEEWHATPLFQCVAGPCEVEHYLVAPLIGHGEIIGALGLGRTARLSAFSEGDLTAVAMVAAHVSLALAYTRDCDPSLMVSLQSLSQREKQIAMYVSMGLDNSEIARELGISVNTVKKYLKTMFEHLGVSRRAELARLATMGRLV